MVCATCGQSKGTVAGHCAACGAQVRVGDSDATTGVLPTVPGVTGSSFTSAAVGAPTISAEVTRLMHTDPSSLGAPIAAGRRLADRYLVIRLVGVGGMGVVYQAWDEELGVAVALKVILAPGADDKAAVAELEKRFKTELLLARQVTHKNVVRIHDLGEFDGIKYITMPYVEGLNLSAVLAKEKLTVRRALHFVRQLAAGLAAAHEAGVVHRDLKPANIMIDADDRALIMDFGIARSASSGAPADRSGTIVGTLEYMAPEQAQGGPVDQRADIYALGLILHEMLTGFHRLRPKTVAELRTVVQQPLPLVRSINAEVPEALEAIVDRCVQPDPDARYTTTGELVASFDQLDDDGQPLPPASRRVSRYAIAVMSAIAVVTLAVSWVIAGRRAANAARPPHPPVSVLIADFDNRANDPVFDGTVEQALAAGVEGASFITSYPRRDAAQIAAALVPGGKLDEKAARLVSVREGIKFVVSGSIEAKGAGYVISMNLIDPGVEKTLKTETASAQTKAEVLQSVGTLAVRLRSDLGDTERRTAAETFTTASLNAVRDYTIAQDLQINSKLEEAIVYYKSAVDADPNFGRAYSGWATTAFELGRKAEADELWKKALSLMDRLSERERLAILGTYSLGITRNYEQAIKNYSELVKLYPADRAGHSNLALASFYTLDFSKALEEGRRALDIYPASLKYRNNYALYAMYAGRFDTAANEARLLLEKNPKFSDAYFPLAVSQLVAGDRDGARDTYQRMAQAEASAASRATMGGADVAMYEARYAAAVAILTAGVADDEKTKNTEGLGSKYAALAEAYEALGRRPQAVAAARKAIAVGPLESTLLPAARVFIAAGDMDAAKALSTVLDKQLQTQTRAYAKIIDGEIALQQDRISDAIDAFRAAAKLYDVWLAHFDLGVAYARAGAGHSAEAVSELDSCMKRRGEATAIFLDDIPSFRYFAPLSYWLAVAQEGVGMRANAVQNYKAYMTLRPPETKDPLAADARKRFAGL